MIELRPEVKKDNVFIETVYYATRETELNLTNWTEQQKKAFTQMQCMAQLYEYKTKFPGAAFRVIIFNKQSAGRAGFAFNFFFTFFRSVHKKSVNCVVYLFGVFIKIL